MNWLVSTCAKGIPLSELRKSISNVNAIESTMELEGELTTVGENLESTTEITKSPIKARMGRKDK